MNARQSLDDLILSALLDAYEPLTAGDLSVALAVGIDAVRDALWRLERAGKADTVPGALRPRLWVAT